MGKVVLVRIDSRLIHGQVMTKWVNQSNANRIIVVSDQLAEDEFMRGIYLLSAPEGVKIDCYTINQVIEEKNDLGDGNILLLLPDLDTAHTIISNGLSISEVQVGGLGGAPHRKVVYQNITLDEKDVNLIESIVKNNVSVYFQTIPEDSPKNFEEIIKKYREG